MSTTCGQLYRDRLTDALSGSRHHGSPALKRNNHRLLATACDGVLPQLRPAARSKCQWHSGAMLQRDESRADPRFSTEKNLGDIVLNGVSLDTLVAELGTSRKRHVPDAFRRPT
jgi:hypothetical protein